MLYPTLWRTNAGSPTDELFSVRREVDRFFDRYFGGTSSQSLTPWMPVVDVHETADAIRVTAELPGLSPEDVNVAVQNGVLTIGGEKKEETEEKDSNYHLFERRYGRFERSFTLPRTVVADDVQAKFQNGVLTITLPKTEEAKPRKIQVQLTGGEGKPQVSAGKSPRAA